RGLPTPRRLTRVDLFSLVTYNSFPVLRNLCPSGNVMHEASPVSPSERTFGFRLAAAGLILGAAALRLVYLSLNCPLDLAPDEAHYWDWSRRLDWSYYSKGPLVAYLIRLSCWLFGSWSEAVADSQMVAVRIPAIICSSLMLAGLCALTVQVFRREKLALGVVA